MRVLLDTHVLIWYFQTDPKMSSTALALLQTPSTIAFVSPASHWELAIKLGTGKLSLNEPFDDFLQRAIFDNGFSILPIETTHSSALLSLRHHHRDPFDRMLIAQGIAEGMPIVSADAVFDLYPVQRLW